MTDSQVLRGHLDAHRRYGTTLAVHLPPDAPFDVVEAIHDVIRTFVGAFPRDPGWDPLVTASSVPSEHITRPTTLAEIRHAADISQRTVATEMHHSSPTVHGIENRPVRALRLDVARAYIAALGGRFTVTATVNGVTYDLGSSP